MGIYMIIFSGLCCGSELGRSGSTNSQFTVSDWLVGKREFSEVIAYHVCFDFDWNKGLSVVNVDNLHW